NGVSRCFHEIFSVAGCDIISLAVGFWGWRPGNFIARFGDRFAFVQFETNGGLHRCFNGGSANFTVTLGGVCIADGKERPFDPYWYVRVGSARQVTVVHIFAVFSRRYDAEMSTVRQRDTKCSWKWLEKDIDSVEE